MEILTEETEENKALKTTNLHDHGKKPFPAPKKVRLPCLQQK